ncbi:MAG TPA: ERF family protein [Cyanophyceae cyanobacterium]
MEFKPTPQLNEALAKAKLAFDPIVANETAAFKTKTGHEIKFDYADLDDILTAVTKALSEHGLALSSTIAPFEARPFLVTRLLHSSGESLESYYPLPLDPGSDPKTFGSALTYGRRYNTLCLLEINTVEDEQSKRERRVHAANEVRREAQRPPATPRTPSTFTPAQARTKTASIPEQVQKLVETTSLDWDKFCAIASEQLNRKISFGDDIETQDEFNKVSAAVKSLVLGATR